jgi:hypothetical protein
VAETPICPRCGASKVFAKDARRAGGRYMRCPARSHAPGKPQEPEATPARGHGPKPAKEPEPASTGPRLVRSNRVRRGVRPVAVKCEAGKATYLYWA